MPLLLLQKGRHVRAHIMKVGGGYTFRREHPDRRSAARLDLIRRFVEISPKRKGEKLTDQQKEQKKDIAKKLAEAVWIDEDGKVVKNKKTLERIKNLKVNNPATVEVRVAATSKDSLQAIVWYINKHGEKKRQYVYASTHHTEKQDAKFVRCGELANIYDSVRKAVEQDAKAGIEEAIILHMMFLTNMRVGNGGDIKTSVKAYGATTLQARHLKVSGNTVLYRFVGKSGVLWNSRIDDAVLARALKPLLEDKEAREQVFSVRDSDVNKYFKQCGDFSSRDIRPLHATAKARHELEKAGFPRNLKQAKKRVKEVCMRVSRILHNTPNVAKAKYIDPIVWGEIEEKFGIKVLKVKQ